jgi:hypothetical protein
MSTNGASPDEMREVEHFMSALRAAIPARPDPGLRATVVPRLAAVARTATLEAEGHAGRHPRTPPARRSRRALVARVAIAVALIPLLFAGLAFAGVTVPAPARDAFSSVGIDLPNQHSKHERTTRSGEEGASAPAGESGGNPASSAAPTTPKGKGGNSAAHEHAKKQHEKAPGPAKGHARAKGNGHARGKAVGQSGSVPPGHDGATGPPAHSNAGGNGGGSGNGNGSSGAAKAPHVPNGNATGQTRVPPGHSK